MSTYLDEIAEQVALFRVPVEQAFGVSLEGINVKSYGDLRSLLRPKFSRSPVGWLAYLRGSFVAWREVRGYFVSGGDTIYANEALQPNKMSLKYYLVHEIGHVLVDKINPNISNHDSMNYIHDGTAEWLSLDFLLYQKDVELTQKEKDLAVHVQKSMLELANRCDQLDAERLSKKAFYAQGYRFIAAVAREEGVAGIRKVIVNPPKVEEIVAGKLKTEINLNIS